LKEGEDVSRERLIKFRGERSQGLMAKIYGVTQQAWSLWEKGLSKPNIIIMKRLEQDSGFPMEELFPDVFNKEILSKTQEDNNKQATA
jgi:DNA-binding XRE family transcriptional regulator